MKRELLIAIAIIYILQINLVLNAQNNLKEKNTSFEDIILMTDRDLYISGENIWFNALCLSNGKFIGETISKITYIELFNEEKQSVIQKKVKIINGKSGSYLEIPEDIETGVYNLIAYTQYMKNFQGFKSNRISIIIINPNKKGNSNLTNSSNLTDDSTTQVNKLHLLDIKLNKKIYNIRENVSLNISDNEYFSKLKHITVSVVKKGSFNSSLCSNIDSEIDIKKIDYKGFEYYPEIRDLTLSGTLNEKESGKPKSNTKIYLSVLSADKQLNITHTDKNGKFIFNLNSLYNNQDIYICTEDKIENSEISINNSFLYGLDDFKDANWFIDSMKIKLIKEMYLNHQTGSFFPEKSEILKLVSNTSDIFFGKPEISININDFIKLPTLHEVFDEIVPFVNIRKRKEDYTFMIYDDKNKTNYVEPLVFYDQIPFFNINELLKIKPKFIDQINVINRKYIIGNYTFNGIIFIKSKTGKLPGISLPKNSIITKYQTVYESATVKFPEYDETNIENDHLPDFRNLLYWNPDIRLKGTKSVEFYTSDHSSEYDVIIRGVSSEGELFFGKTSFEVKK